MRKAVVVGLGAGLALLACAAVGLAGSGPRLEGTFKVTGTVKDDDFTPPITGTKVHDTYKFKPTCASGGCRKVKLTRDAGGRNVKSVLRRIKPRVYKGSEGPEPYTCVDPLGDPGTFTGVNKVKITDTDHGLATKIAGTYKGKFQGCTETFEDIAFRGRKK